MKRFGIGLILALACAGCGYHKMPKLEHLKRSAAQIVKRTNNVELRAKRLSDTELCAVLGGRQLSSKQCHFICVQVTIKNKSNAAVFLDVKALPQVTLAAEVAAVGLGCTLKSCNDTGRQTAHYVFGGGLAWLGLGLLAPSPLCILFLLDSPHANVGMVYALSGFAFVAVVALAIAAVVGLKRSDPVACSRALMQQLRERILDDLMVRPHSVGSTLVFVKQESGFTELTLPVMQFANEHVLFTARIPLVAV